MNAIKSCNNVFGNRSANLPFVTCVVVFAALSSSRSFAAAMPCETLLSLNLADTTITMAQSVAAGAFVPPTAITLPPGAPAPDFKALPAFCRVAATVKPTQDSDIKIEVWLPSDGWNGKFQAVGNGGWGGTIPYSALSAALASGYVAAGTDTGHDGAGNANFALGHPEKIVDLAFRSIHEMTVQAKTLINTHYGTPAKFSYYNGCSQGGRQGLAAAQKYPEDFNGIIAGAASWDQMRIHGARVALNLLVNKDADSIIPPSKYPMIHQAVLNACDASDGVKDGVIENPLQCRFDYAQLACKAGDNAECLTKGQVESAKTMTSALKDPKSGKVLFDKYLMPGSELGWATLGGPEPLPLSTSGMKNVVFQNPSWDYHTMNISADVDRAANSDSGAMYTGDPDLNPFFAHGGKLLMYHGWTDPQISPLLSITYYNKVVKTVGKNNATKSIALFMMPGMDHCRGGSGPAEFDAVNTLEQWVEQARTPQQIIASHKTDGKVDRTRPLCPYPQVAKYKGAGSTDEAANFVCKAQ